MVDIVANRLLEFLHAVEEPLRMRFCVMSLNQRSMTFNHELLVGVKCR